MALMFPRIARNFAKSGYYPTDAATLERTLTALAPCPGVICAIDPCSGEGIAMAEVAHALGRSSVRAHGVEYDLERAQHASSVLDRCIHGDLMDTVISRQSFGVMWLNPPYGDLAKSDVQDSMFHGRARLEKLFYQKTYQFLQYDGVLILIIPRNSLDNEFIGWLSRHFTSIRVFRAVETQFRQVVIFGQRTRYSDLDPVDAKESRARLQEAMQDDNDLPELPEEWPELPYMVPSSSAEPQHFYRTTLEPVQFAAEAERLQGLWPTLDTHFGISNQALRPPARALSRWHLSLALAAGAISGVVQSRSGRIFVLRGDTLKDKVRKVEFSERDDGTIVETHIDTDRFVPVIRAWDVTPQSESFGQIVTIH